MQAEIERWENEKKTIEKKNVCIFFLIVEPNLNWSVVSFPPPPKKGEEWDQSSGGGTTSSSCRWSTLPCYCVWPARRRASCSPTS